MNSFFFTYLILLHLQQCLQKVSKFYFDQLIFITSKQPLKTTIKMAMSQLRSRAAIGTKLLQVKLGPRATPSQVMFQLINVCGKFQKRCFLLWWWLFLTFQGLFLSYIFFSTSTTCTTKKHLLSNPFVKKQYSQHPTFALLPEEGKSGTRGTRRIFVSPLSKMQSKHSCYECHLFSFLSVKTWYLQDILQ